MSASPRPDLCPTCSQAYDADAVCYCSDAFHMCRDCEWNEDRLVHPCDWHAAYAGEEE
jgi:hypothetical protein